MPERAEVFEQDRAGTVMPNTILSFNAAKAATWVVFSRVEPGSRAQAIACNA